ncbi:MAG: lytic transglycosylase domain-containing protein [Bacteroidia bacterium]|nr:lytic transglycosylase domain-containing protein [Bacteroidia bacterium]MDW8302668.1 lytic transglycosylase domain-containing protein [Bacteroidia bacterium]
MGLKKSLSKAVLASAFLIVQVQAAEGPCKVLLPRPNLISTNSYSIQDFIVSETTKYGIDPDFALSHAYLESNFNYKAVSSAGCIGLFQFLPYVAESYCKTAEEKRTWRDDPKVQVVLYCRMMSYLLKKYNGDYDLALLEYGGGPKAVYRYGKSKNLPYLKRIHKHICIKKVKKIVASNLVTN